VNTSGSTVDSWTNSAGISDLDVTEAGAQRPTLVQGAVNGYDEVSFNGSNRLTTAVGAITTTNFVTSEASTFVVCRADNTTQTSTVYTTDPLVNAPGTRFSNHIPWSGSVYFDIGTCCANRIQVSGLTNLDSYSVWSYDAINTATGKQLYRNGQLLQSVGVAALTYSGHAGHKFNLGGNSGGTAGFVGDVTEVIIFTTKINTAQRLIIQNYLAAKYGIALAANDLYTMDNGANGDFDHDVAGIGRVNSTNVQSDSRGTGIVRILNPTVLDDGDYYFWGHDNGVLVAQATDVPTGVEGRYTRIWRGQEVGVLADLDIEFDLTGQGPVTAGDLRLLIDMDNDGNFGDETVAGGGVVSSATDQGGNVYRFADVTGLVSAASSTRRFTLGTTNIIQTPLPITLLSFNAFVENNNSVRLQWITAQEVNNDFFTVERSANGIDWETVVTLAGSGTTLETREYKWLDEKPFWGQSYYRLKQTDFDGTSTYSKIVSVKVSKTFQDVIVYPVPAKDELFVEFARSENVVLKIIDQLGRESQVKPTFGPRGASIDTSELTPGVYFLHLTNGREHACKKIIIED
jgi:hypothetical protein